MLMVYCLTSRTILVIGRHSTIGYNSNWPISCFGRAKCLVETLWRASLPEYLKPPFKSRDDLYNVIDDIPFGELGWESFTMGYPHDGESSEGVRPSWMDGQYEVWHRNSLEAVESLISNPDFEGEFDYSPHQDYVNGKHSFQNLMLGNWAWRQAVSQGHSTKHTPHIQWV